MDSDTVDLHFQCKDILGRDIFIGKRDDSDSDERPSGKDKISNRRYQILLFGLTETGESVCLQVDNFCPFFYIRIPDVLRADIKAVKHMKTWLLNGVPMDEHRHTKIEVETHKTLWDYNGAKDSTFLKVTVPSQALWRSLKDKLLNKSSVPIEYKIRELFGETAVEALVDVRVGEEIESLSADGTCMALKIYESNIDPMLRFFHIQDVSPAGWVKVLAGNWTEVDSNDARASILAVADWGDVVSGSGSVAPYLIGSWDIECYSSHGDFPQATKTWRKPVREILDTGVTVSNVKSLCVSLAKAIKGESKLLSPIYLKNTRVDLTGETLRVYLEQQGMEAATEKALTSLRCAGNREAKEEAVAALDNILTECFPSIAGDEIIQIGTVLYKQGVAVSKHIWVLGTTDAPQARERGPTYLTIKQQKSIIWFLVALLRELANEGAYLSVDDRTAMFESLELTWQKLGARGRRDTIASIALAVQDHNQRRMSLTLSGPSAMPPMAAIRNAIRPLDEIYSGIAQEARRFMLEKPIMAGLTAEAAAAQRAPLKMDAIDKMTLAFSLATKSMT